jgi:hypothetical protein
MKDVDFLRAVLDTSILYVEMIENMTPSGKQASESKPKRIKFGFCSCEDCESMKWIAHADKRRAVILVSRKAFEKELSNRANNGMGFFTLIYGLMRAYLSLLHPYSSQKTIEHKTNRYFKKAMQVIAKDGLNANISKVSV